MMNEHISQVNQAAYARADIVKYYQGIESLYKTEQVLFDKLLPTIKDSKILDIGVGGGRTTRYLLSISRDYTGVDYVRQFAEATQKKYENAEILCGDVRDMKEFQAETFDFALFSYNGIDHISNAERVKALKEIYRVLKKDGIFMFSSHNRDYRYFDKFPWQQKIHFNRSYLLFCLHCLYYLPNHFRMKQHEIHTEDYAVINDGDHRYSLLIYYIGIDKQIEQLTDIGFSGSEAYNMAGETVTSDVSSHWIYYLAKKS